MNNKVQVTFRTERTKLNKFDEFVKRSGLSREECLRTLIDVVVVCDVKPSDTCLYKAYREIDE